jgi:hypothetical protein
MGRGELPGTIEAVSVATGERFEATPTIEAAKVTALRVAGLVSELREALAAADDVERRGAGWCRYCPLLAGCDEGAVAVAVTSS